MEKLGNGAATGLFLGPGGGLGQARDLPPSFRCSSSPRCCGMLLEGGWGSGVEKPWELSGQSSGVGPDGSLQVL